jgi:hypothetical protein
MSDIERIQLFEGKRVRTVWNDQEEKWYFSVKAEPFKLWMARVASERIDEIQDPELAIMRRAVSTKKRIMPFLPMS